MYQLETRFARIITILSAVQKPKNIGLIQELICIVPFGGTVATSIQSRKVTRVTESNFKCFVPTTGLQSKSVPKIVFFFSSLTNGIQHPAHPASTTHSSSSQSNDSSFFFLSNKRCFYCQLNASEVSPPEAFWTSRGHLSVELFPPVTSTCMAICGY